MNKHLVAIVTLGAVMGGSVMPALAKEGSGMSRASFKEVRQERQDQREMNGIKNQANRDALRTTLDAKRAQQSKDRVSKFWSKSSAQLQKLIDRETKMSAKIAERLAKFKAAGKNTSSQEALLATANASIATAQTALTNARVTIQAMITANASPADITAKTRELHKDVTTKIRAAHKALVDVIVATRGMSATATPSVTPTP